MLEASGRRLATIEDLLRRGHFDADERREVSRALASLIRRGIVVETRRDRYALAARRQLRAGRLHLHPDGYGFVIADEEPGGGRAEREDLYIGGSGVRPAMHGDRVLATVQRRGRDPRERVEGRVVDVLERRTTRLVGTIRHGRFATYLVPQDPRIPYRVRIVATGGDDDGASDTTRRSAERPRRDDGGLVAADGEMAVAEITRYPTGHDDIEARVIAVLGPASDPRVETEAVIYKHDLPREFPDEVRREAESIPRAVELPPTAVASIDALPPAADTKRRWHETPTLATRVDLRDVPLVTIDGENARDFDDAVALVESPTGGSRLLVAIADVAAYVARGSALDLEARARGTSVYFPDRVIPMLPEALSNGICSLNPDADRLVQAALLDFDRRGEMLGATIFPGVMRSHARLTYTEVRQIVEDRDLAVRRRHAPLVDDLERMIDLAELLARVRRRRGSIDFDLPEAEIVLDLQGRPENIVKAERNAAHRMIESFMLAANEAVASYLTARHIPMPYRIHEPPDPDARDDLARFLAGFGVRLPRGDDLAPSAIQHALAQVAGRPEERLINTILLRSMKQARYSPVNAGHFGLAARCYTHFTSPIRRYPDLVLHRILTAVLRDDTREIAAATADLAAVTEESSRRERVAMDAEREVVQLKKVQFMQDKVGETFTGFISGVVPFGFFVELEQYFVEGLVHVATLTDDRYELIEERHLLQGRRRRRVFRVGDPVTVRVASVSVERKQIDLVLVDAS